MSDDIKPGDLVMVVRGSACCGATHGVSYGSVFKVLGVGWGAKGNCLACGKLHPRAQAVLMNSDLGIWQYRVKKIDPPAEGDSLPTRADLELPA